MQVAHKFARSPFLDSTRAVPHIINRVQGGRPGLNAYITCRVGSTRSILMHCLHHIGSIPATMYHNECLLAVSMRTLLAARAWPKFCLSLSFLSKSPDVWTPQLPGRWSHVPLQILGVAPLVS